MSNHDAIFGGHLMMNAENQKQSNQKQTSRWQRFFKGFAIGAFFGAVTASGITAAVLGIPSFTDTSPSIIGGTRMTGSFLITFFWGIIGAAGGSLVGAIINLPKEGKWKMLLAGMIAAVIAGLLLVLNTTSPF
jgi:hypothetical protein